MVREHFVRCCGLTSCSLNMFFRTAGTVLGGSCIFPARTILRTPLPALAYVVPFSGSEASLGREPFCPFRPENFGRAQRPCSVEVRVVRASLDPSCIRRRA